MGVVFHNSVLFILYFSLLTETITRHVVSLHARFGNHFADRLPIDLLHPLIGKFRVAFAGPNGRMPQEFLDRDDLGAGLQEIGGKGMAQTMTAGLDASRLGIALDLFLNAFRG